MDGNLLAAYLPLKACNLSGNTVDDDASPALGDPVVMLSANDSLKAVRPEEVEEDAQLLDWGQVFRMVGHLLLSLLLDQVKYIDKTIFGKTKDLPERQFLIFVENLQKYDLS